jgi:phosphonate transport system substrate-binding protein
MLKPQLKPSVTLIFLQAVFAGLVVLLLLVKPAIAQVNSADRLIFGVGLYQPDREKNDATYRPLAQYLSEQLGQEITLRTVDSWEGLAKSLAAGQTDMALMGPWGYVLANHFSDAQAVATIQYQGRPEYFALMVTHPESGITSAQDLLSEKAKSWTFAFGDKGSTSGYLIPSYFFHQHNINPETHFKRVLYTKHQAIEMQVAAGLIDAGADYNRNRTAMIEHGLLDAKRSVVIWESDPLPNDAFVLSQRLFADKAFVQRLQQALLSVEEMLKTNPNLLPANYTGFIASDNGFYKPIRDAGLALGRLAPRQ